MTKPLKTCLILVFIAGVTTSYLTANRDKDFSASDLDITEFTDSPRETLTALDLQHDIEILMFAMDSAYAGKIAYPAEYAAMKDKIEKLPKLHSKGLSQKLLRKELSEILDTFPDGHLSVDTPENSYIIAPTRYLASIPDRDNCKAVIEFQSDKKDRQTLMVTIPTFLADKNTLEYLESFYEKIGDAKKVIFDLRGNSGGFISIPHKLAARLWGEEYRENNYIQYFPSPKKSTYSLNGAASYQLQTNVTIISNPRKLAELRKNNRNIFTKIWNYNEYAEGSLQKKWYDASDYVDHVEQEINTYEDEPSSLEEKGFNHPIIVIVDKTCASACEHFLESLELHPHVTVMGERTAGMVQFGSIGLVQLPKSHLTIPIARTYFEYKDKRRVERIGYPPHILISPNEDPLEKALGL
ncbi:S41 family peptidase [Bdellovibrio bacteriovorus]|uniref:S41 family peptidase n=1 Tax=Bdellovibrio bacteriovorus TaxID=959 RepID=UPI0035A5BD6D